jgi:hypothetical protein
MEKKHLEESISMIEASNVEKVEQLGSTIQDLKQKQKEDELTKKGLED